jgi:hypothetical protein
MDNSRGVEVLAQATYETTYAVPKCELGSYEIYFIKIRLLARPAD